MFRDLAMLLMLASLPLLTSAKSESGEFIASFRLGQNGEVLDGDTLLLSGEALKIAGIDSPELGPWAKCWAEAALAGHAKAYVETQLSEGDWRVVIATAPYGNGTKLARVIRPSDGEDLSDLMIVYGYAAQTSGRWNWCGENANLHSPDEDEPEPHGPTLWWPTGAMFDPRAAD